MLMKQERKNEPLIEESLKFVLLSEEINEQNERYERRKQTRRKS